MSIIGRIARLFKADVHSILDSIEDPQAVLTQSLRDMQEGILRHETRVKETSGAKLRCQKRLSDFARTSDELRSQTELCIRNGNDSLARAVIRKRLESETEGTLVAKHLDKLTREEAASQALLQRQREKLSEIREKAALFQHAHADVDAVSEPAEQPRPISESDIEVMLLAERERISRESSGSIVSK